jgi:DNA-binding MarR family transcriptional regulator
MTKPPRFAAHQPVSFLLAQVGAHAAGRFAERLAPLGLKPPDAGILRLLAQSPGASQQELAAMLRIHASRLVAVVDDLEARGLIERRENREDRRTYALFLTEKGSSALADVGRVAREHNDALCASLSAAERGVLSELLARVAEQEGLTAGVHPGYRALGARPSRL